MYTNVATNVDPEIDKVHVHMYIYIYVHIDITSTDQNATDTYMSI